VLYPLFCFLRFGANKVVGYNRTMTKKEIEIKKLEKECLEFSYNHPLYKKGTKPVFGEGSLKAKIMLIGEAPGYYESISGYPFCGAAGKVLDELFKSIGIKRKEVYITNVVKIRPPNNRNPKSEEIKAFSPYLERQIEIIQPKVIATLGNFATAFILKKYGFEKEIQGISRIHGKIFIARVSLGDIKIIPLYHPAVVVYNQKMKKELEKDFKILTKVNERR